MTVRLSVLDRSSTRQGQSDARALRDTVRFARQAEELGYHRFWVSEHHSVPGLAGSAPTVLAAAVAAATERIRVGTGGVMLPNHRPLVVAEQFGVLEALYPGRIDMGLGRSVGFTNGVRRALGQDKEAADAFADQLGELLGYFSGDQRAHPGVHARPGEGMAVSPFLLATGAGAEIAAGFGLPLVVGGPRSTEAISRYRNAFRPSGWAQSPYVVVAATVAVAETMEQARRLLLPEAWSTAHSRTRGEFPPLRSPEEVLALELTDRERTLLDEALRGQIHGTAAEVAAALGELVERTGADEVLVTMSTYDRADMLDSYRRLAELTVPGANRSAVATNGGSVAEGITGLFPSR
ncbi:MsnO8 family LLM class oxidoreductase [Crossiella sp. CA-258035]|uniref:MsnO8 family LLM class oxidoreductase n=1 Tax=Crossiella sp. CA-258035 TaxID=2981138 RepID=UPI0024BC64BD|nr:MsnO8 family LLM class oxidoreductase [Crossiella sp. CA-258035]WHT17584.1 MsnO8 family LLM class oxidoreductase [Crossiella sp. CA-258035]